MQIVDGAPEAESEPDSDPEATPASDPEPTPAPAAAEGELPAQYFRAAGDPDEPEPEPEPSPVARLLASLQNTAAAARAWAEPKWVAFAGRARAAGAGVVRFFKGLRRPRGVRETAVWAGAAAGVVLASMVAFFFFVTWGMPSTDDLWEARQGQSITFLD
ncbi:MAG TPA: hypothetical protein PKY87_09370, partial [Terricaulis sp.]|nr:hypothetical protein [Terricaulis sp.]